MPMGRTPSSGGPAGMRARAWAAATILACATAGLAAVSCQKDKILEPGSVQSNVVTATYVPAAEFRKHGIVLDGIAKQEEWGGAFDNTRPFSMIRMSAEDGGGDPGPPMYLATKAIVTDTDLFLLFQWEDPREDDQKDAMFYMGPDLRLATGLQPDLENDAYWVRGRDANGRIYDEDRLYVAFEIEPTGDASGSFRTQGCQVACHAGESPRFGRPGYGRLDVWEWLATRTNPVRNLYTPTDNPNFPRYGIPGYLDDYFADPGSGLVPDPGTPAWRENWEPGHTRPLYVYRPRVPDDPLANPDNPSTAVNGFGEKALANNRLPYYYIWRENMTATIEKFSQSDTLNNAVLPQGQPARKWHTGDAVGGYYYSYPYDPKKSPTGDVPGGSRANVRGKAVYSNGLWTLEVGRPLDTGDQTNDAVFNWHVGADSVMTIPDIYFTAGVANNSKENHWGSGPQILRFAARYPVTRQAVRPGGER